MDVNKIKRLVLATHNKGKVKELSLLLAPLGIEVVSAGDLGLPEPEETGLTFHDNAKLKAVAAAQAAKLPALADDSGMVVPALDGQPGIYSARWAGPDKNFAAATERVKRELLQKHTPHLMQGLDSASSAECDLAASGYDAHFMCVLSLAQPDGSSIEFEGRMDGKLTFPPRGTNGFGYDPIFVPNGDTRTYGEMTLEEKNQTNHRAKAFAKFDAFLQDQLQE